MGDAIRSIMWWIVVVLVVAKTGSAFPMKSSSTKGYDVQQYELAKAVSEEPSKEPIDDPEQEYDEWHETPMVSFLTISKETINKICQDLDVDILIESDNRMIDCNTIRLQLLPVTVNLSIDDFVSDRVKREDLGEQEDGSGAYSLEDTNETHDNGSSLPSSNHSHIHSQLKVEKEPSGLTKNHITQTNKTDKAIFTSHEQENTKNGTSIVETHDLNNGSLPVSASNSSHLVNQTVAAITSPNSNLSGNATAQHISHPDLNTTKTNSTTKEGAITHLNHTNANNTKEGTIDLPTLKYNNGTNITKEQSVEGLNKTEIHRKGKHMEVDTSMPFMTGADSTERKKGKASIIQGPNPANSSQIESGAPQPDMKKSKGNTTIIWLVFGAVVIAGSALVAYKYINKRRAKKQAQPTVRPNANERPLVASNNAAKEQEMRPLMSDVDKTNNVKHTTGDATNATDPGTEQVRSSENGTGDHTRQVGTIRENNEPTESNVNSQTSEE